MLFICIIILLLQGAFTSVFYRVYSSGHSCSPSTTALESAALILHLPAQSFGKLHRFPLPLHTVLSPEQKSQLFTIAPHLKDFSISDTFTFPLLLEISYILLFGIGFFFFFGLFSSFFSLKRVKEELGCGNSQTSSHLVPKPAKSLQQRQCFHLGIISTL